MTPYKNTRCVMNSGEYFAARIIQAKHNMHIMHCEHGCTALLNSNEFLATRIMQPMCIMHIMHC